MNLDSLPVYRNSWLLSIGHTTPVQHFTHIHCIGAVHISSGLTWDFPARYPDLQTVDPWAPPEEKVYYYPLNDSPTVPSVYKDFAFRLQTSGESVFVRTASEQNIAAHVFGVAAHQLPPVNFEYRDALLRNRHNRACLTHLLDPSLCAVYQATSVASAIKRRAERGLRIHPL
jgi:hypothetical protein